jgi:hypothetical protein
MKAAGTESSAATRFRFPPASGIGRLVIVLLSPHCEAVRFPMNRNIYLTVTATLFLGMAIVHLLRIILGWQAEIGGVNIPFWVSWLAVPVTGALAYFGFRQHR